MFRRLVHRLIRMNKIVARKGTLNVVITLEGAGPIVMVAAHIIGLGGVKSSPNNALPLPSFSFPKSFLGRMSYKV